MMALILRNLGVMMWQWVRSTQVGGKLRPNSEGTDEMEKNVMLRPAIVSRAMQKLKDAMTPRDIPEDHVFDADWLGQRAKANQAKVHERLHVEVIASTIATDLRIPMRGWSENGDGSYTLTKGFDCGHEVEIIVKPKQKPVAIISMDII